MSNNHELPAKSAGTKVLQKFMTAVFPNKGSKDTHHTKHHSRKHTENNDSDSSAKKILETHPRSMSVSGFPNKLEYNPYGIYNHHDIVNLGQAFSQGVKRSEPDHRLISPFSNPNDYLPKDYEQKYTNLEDSYELLNIDIGEGGSATIKKVILKSDTPTPGKLFALKKFSLFSGETQSNYYHRVSHEFVVTKSIKHPNCVACYDLLQLPITLQNAWGMTMDYFEYDLFKLLKSSNWKNVAFDEKMCIFKQICFGIKFLHENDFTHLDIKAENVLVSKNGLMKITDYGCVEQGHTKHGEFDTPVLKISKRLGTPPYQPPEVAKYGIMDDNRREPFCPFKFDYWSLGILLFTIVTGKLPFSCSKDSDSGYKLYTMEYIKMIEKLPTFKDGNSTKLPKSGVFSNAHGYDSFYLYLFWRLCDPNVNTRISLPQVFKLKEFQRLEMCVDEGLYEANFCCYKKSEDMSFEIPFGSPEEITQQNELRHSSWDEIPTIQDQNGHYKYRSLLSSQTISAESGDSYTRDSHNQSNSIFCPDDLHTTNMLDLLSEAESQEKSTSQRSIALPLSHHQPSCVNSNLSMCIGTKQHVFDEDDYDSNSATKFMIVNPQDAFTAASCPISPHSHNALYSYVRSRSHTVATHA